MSVRAARNVAGDRTSFAAASLGCVSEDKVNEIDEKKSSSSSLWLVTQELRISFSPLFILPSFFNYFHTFHITF